MKILLVGNGGREHTLLWRLRLEAPGSTFLVTRPNAGMAEGVRAVDLAPTDVEGIAARAEAEEVDLVVVGPEAPLAGGLADRLGERGVPCFGPSAGAARIEASKAFAKALMRESGVPTAAYRTFTEIEPALRHLGDVGAPVVVKASGLAAGKGAVVCPTLDEAEAAARDMLEGGAFGEAGEKVVVEEFMEGEELSVFGVTDGREVHLLLPSRDHKRVGEGDTGPNTGGMGAYSPVGGVGPELLDGIRDRIFLPVLEALAREGTPYRGLLYAGLMLTADGPRVVEFNCRFGDPEAQVVLPLLDSPLLDLLLPVARGEALPSEPPRFRTGAAVTTVLASGGYPGAYPKGIPMEIPRSLEEREDLLLFHAGTARLEDGTLVTAGGRVLAVTGLGVDVEEAAARSREGAEAIRFEGKHFRRDIAWRETGR